MSCSYSYKDFGNFLQEKNTIIFPKEAGILKTDTIVINKNISLHRNSFKMYKDTSIEYDFTLNGITINIALEADFLFQSNISNFFSIQKTNNTIMSMVNHEKGKAQYKANTNLKNIIIFVKQDFLKNILKDSSQLEDLVNHINEKKLSKALKSQVTNIKTRICAYEIFIKDYQNSLDELFIQSKVLEILSYEFENFIQKEKSDLKTISYSEYDLKALEKVKSILISNMQNPPSIIELSKQVKLNEFKLKHGFKKLFKVTPYNFLLEYKLCEAKQMLEKGELNVSEVAFAIGYKQVHGFSNAFYKRFGIRPKELIKNRKYY